MGVGITSPPVVRLGFFVGIGVGDFTAAGVGVGGTGVLVAPLSGVGVGVTWPALQQ